MDKLFEEQGGCEKKIEEWANTHPRTPYKQAELLAKAKEIDAELEQWEKGNNITAHDYERSSKNIFVHDMRDE